MRPKAQKNRASTASASEEKARSTINILIVEPSKFFRTGLDYILSGSLYRIVAQIDMKNNDILSTIAKSSPNLIILGTSIERQELVEAARYWKSRYPKARLICIRKSGEIPDIDELLRIDVAGVLTADSGEGVLVKSLDLVMSGETVVPNHFLRDSRLDDAIAEDGDGQFSARAQNPPRAVDSVQGSLSRREHEILRLLVNGDTNKTIGFKLSLSDATVKVHVKGILRKIQVQNRTQAAIWALHNLSD